MDIKELRQILRKVKVVKWTEAGVNIFRKNDSLINKEEVFSRLNYYDNLKHLQFCDRCNCVHGSFGCLTLSDGNKIYYNII